MVALGEDEATDALEAAGLVVEVRTESAGPEEDAGEVIEQLPAAGSMTPRGGTVVVIVADPAEPSEVSQLNVPDVLGLTAAEAATALAEVGFASKVNGDPDGVVVEQEPRAGSELAAGEVVELTLTDPEQPQPGEGLDAFGGPGTALALPKAPRGEIEVVAHTGILRLGFIGLLIHNNTTSTVYEAAVAIKVKEDGSLVATETADDVAPHAIEAGSYAIADAKFLRRYPDESLEFKVTSAPENFYPSRIDFPAEELGVTKSGRIFALVGSATAPSDVELPGVSVMCFDAEGRPRYATTDYGTPEYAEKGDEITFQTEFVGGGGRDCRDPIAVLQGYE